MAFEQADLSEGCPTIFLGACPLNYISEDCPTIFLEACLLNYISEGCLIYFDIGECLMSFKNKNLLF